MVDQDVHAVEAARSVLLELATLLRRHGSPVVIIGGWAAGLLPSKEIIPHVGTVDVDLVLDHRNISEQGKPTLMEALQAHGYRKGRERFQYFRTVISGIGPVDVRVDFLTPVAEEGGPGGTPQTVQGLETLTLRGADLALTQTVEKELEGRLPDGKRIVASVQITSTVPFLVLKSLALFDRRERKDAYDIYHRLKNYPGELEPYLVHGVVREALDKLATSFRFLYSEGPTFVADFMAPESAEERSFLKRDAYEMVNFLLERLGFRLP